MDSLLRRATPLVLIALAIAVWFEDGLLGKEVGMIRFVVGVLCIYVLLLVLERQRMDAQFKGVLGQFKSFYEQRAVAQGGGDAQKSLEAIGILIAALNSTEAEVRESAYDNLKRLTGNDFGDDPADWQAWLAEARAGVEASEVEKKP